MLVLAVVVGSHRPGAAVYVLEHPKTSFAFAAEIAEKVHRLTLAAKMPDQDLAVDVGPHGSAMMAAESFAESFPRLGYSPSCAFFSLPGAKRFRPYVGLF